LSAIVKHIQIKCMVSGDPRVFIRCPKTLFRFVQLLELDQYVGTAYVQVSGGSRLAERLGQVKGCSELTVGTTEQSLFPLDVGFFAKNQDTEIRWGEARRFKRSRPSQRLVGALQFL